VLGKEGGIRLKNLILFVTVMSVIVVPTHLTQAGSQMTITKKDNGKEMTVKKGDTIQIELEALGGAGFMWEFEDFDEGHLEIVKEETRDVSKEGFTGAAVTKVWQLRVKKAGEAAITMYYYRPWEGKDKAADKFAITLRIP
jgi:predicted secreted protein